MPLHLFYDMRREGFVRQPAQPMDATHDDISSLSYILQCHDTVYTATPEKPNAHRCVIVQAHFKMHPIRFDGLRGK